MVREEEKGKLDKFEARLEGGQLKGQVTYPDGKVAHFEGKRAPLLMSNKAPSWGRAVTLFDGKTLNGWKPEGKAAWTVEDGAIVGRQGAGNAPGDLFTTRQWANFELEAEFKVTWPANSGIWFRYVDEKHAYQADILDDPNYKALTGSIYASGKMFVAENRDRSTINKEGWNRIRIRASGEDLAITLNDKPVASVRDSTFVKPGSIGIQVHPGNQFATMEIRVRNIRLRPL
jgi:hypothetical protein